MSKIVTTKSPANIAFIKYWGRKDHKLFIPANDNISMTMSGCNTVSSAILRDDLETDLVEVKFFEQEYKVLEPSTIKARDLFAQIERIRKLSGKNAKVHIRTENNFPADAGIASSASSFSALTAALLLVYGLEELYEDKVELSRQIRLCGSSSAVRSAMGGFVELETANDSEGAHCVQIADENHWDLVDIVAVVDPEKKRVQTSEGHELADTSPYFRTRIVEMQQRIVATRQAIIAKDFLTLGPLIEADTISMHSVMMTQDPPLIYWGPGTLSIMHELQEWRTNDNVHAYFSIDAGPNVHVICLKQDAAEVQARLNKNKYVKWTIYNEPCAGVHETEFSLFD